MAESWTWQTLYGPSTLHKDERVIIDDGTEGFVETVDLRPNVPRILIVQRVDCRGTRLNDRWIIPANIDG